MVNVNEAHGEDDALQGGHRGSDERNGLQMQPAGCKSQRVAC